jgi:hypothetical protein
LKIQWILNDAPREHQAVWVHRAATPQETVARLRMVQEFVDKSPYPGHPVPILESTMSDEGWPADRIDAIGRKFQAAVPECKLPAAQQGQGSGSKECWPRGAGCQPAVERADWQSAPRPVRLLALLASLNFLQISQIGFRTVFSPADGVGGTPGPCAWRTGFQPVKPPALCLGDRLSTWQSLRTDPAVLAHMEVRCEEAYLPN